jgi:hypothetical protein
MIIGIAQSTMLKWKRERMSDYAGIRNDFVYVRITIRVPRPTQDRMTKA